MRTLLLKEILLLLIKTFVAANFTAPNNNQAIINATNTANNAALAFKNNVPFISSISKINNTLIDNVEDLGIVMLMCNWLEYSENYSKTT